LQALSNHSWHERARLAVSRFVRKCRDNVRLTGTIGQQACIEKLMGKPASGEHVVELARLRDFL